MLDTTRRRLLGTTLVGAGALLTGLGLARGETLTTRGKIMLDAYPTPPAGLVEAATFPLIEAIHGRRSRRFARGATIPNGPLAFASRHAPEPLDPLEQMLLIATIAGNTGWAELFAHHPDYAGRLPNYTTAAGGRSFPSSAGFNTSEFFFTDDSGVYFLPTRDMTPPAVAGRHRPRRLGRGAPRPHRQARRRPAEHPGRDRRTWRGTTPGAPTSRARR